MSRHTPFLLLLLAGAGGCQSSTRALTGTGLTQHVALQQTRDGESACEEGLCRPARLVRFALGKGSSVERQQPELPYVHADAIYVLPGDDFTVTGDIEGDRLVHLRLVRPGEKPAHSLAVRFGQSGDGAEPVMLLLLDSKLPQSLTYQATIVPLGRDAHEPTSTCPLRARAGGSEAWPFPIELLVMRELRLEAPSLHHAPCR
ncbi:MAG: hypothetical protein L0Y66_22245 [Myxococcaceae bacterium]|nr:hypothetical protein [Myxococcaceae bacterium]